MALPKLYDPITWHNNTTPALNEDNLNAMSQAIDDIDDRVIDLAGTIMEDVPQIIEDMATVEAGLETVGQAVTDAQTAATAATADKLKSEGYAVGEQNGVPVDSSSPYYHNNSKYYSTVASGSSAAHITYNNSDSHLAATNVQTAIDEVVEDLADEVETRAELGAHNIYPVTLAMVKKNNSSGTWTGNVLVKQGITWTFTANTRGYITEVDADGQLSSGVAYTAVNLSVAADGLDFGVTNKNDKTSAGAKADGYILSSGANGISGDSSVYIAYFANDKTVALRIDGENKSVSHHKFYPMIRLATDSDPTYQPYAMTNQELTDAKIDASQIAPIENGATASTSYAQGAYFIHNGKFCKAKTSISSGATFTKGTNYEETTVAAELIALA